MLTESPAQYGAGLELHDYLCNATVSKIATVHVLKTHLTSAFWKFLPNQWVGSLSTMCVMMEQSSIHVSKGRVYRMENCARHIRVSTQK